MLFMMNKELEDKRQEYFYKNKQSLKEKHDHLRSSPVPSGQEYSLISQEVGENRYSSSESFDVNERRAEHTSMGINDGLEATPGNSTKHFPEKKCTVLPVMSDLPSLENLSLQSEKSNSPLSYVKKTPWHEEFPTSTCGKTALLGSSYPSQSLLPHSEPATVTGGWSSSQTSPRDLSSSSGPKYDRAESTNCQPVVQHHIHNHVHHHTTEITSAKYVTVGGNINAVDHTEDSDKEGDSSDEKKDSSDNEEYIST
ncbi:hypothetical protein EGW08_018865 [Elysia chlorotica]|uniref:Uncharacterized protein n=1 Tax=Elysia chlorotica TaxID=188477 RepID=A0A3S0ZR55_ELYCH|nr:hypothetical protein EGW08_018865 [Elysia chlorotica]